MISIHTHFHLMLFYNNLVSALSARGSSHRGSLMIELIESCRVKYQLYNSILPTAQLYIANWTTRYHQLYNSILPTVHLYFANWTTLYGQLYLAKMQDRVSKVSHHNIFLTITLNSLLSLFICTHKMCSVRNLFIWTHKLAMSMFFVKYSYSVGYIELQSWQNTVILPCSL